ncbi:MAG: SdrD B-like domain-containing protein [Candidatus Hadarchaeales archaeon]
MKKLPIALCIALVFTAMATPVFVQADGQAGTTLGATVDVTPHWTITYEWTIDKSVDIDSWELYPGESGVSTYTITVTKDDGTEEAWVEGTVCVTNGGDRATEGLQIKVVLKNGYEPPNDYLAEADVDVSSNPVLDPGETGCYPYRININITGGAYPQPHAGGTYKVTANVTITNHSGHLGEPFGPSPSATTTWPASQTLINDAIHVEDTNGSSWEFNESGSVTYEKTFTCEDEGVNVNTATIRETEQSDSATVTVICIKNPDPRISGVKFYDANLNGERDDGESLIAGWRIQLWKMEDCESWTLMEETETNSEGEYAFYFAADSGTYKVVEVMPSGMWVQTAPTGGEYIFSFPNGETYTGIDFGNVCLIPGTGGKTIGFWSNRNGQALITSSDVTVLNTLNLYRPSGWSYPPFSSVITTAKSQIKNYLLNATAKEMRWMLSAQLIATQLNVLHSFLDASTVVYSDATGFITIGEIMDGAKTALTGSDRPTQGHWKNLLDGLNNNRLPFVCPEPCEVEYP